jgi:hypothetical protein
VPIVVVVVIRTSLPLFPSPKTNTTIRNRSQSLLQATNHGSHARTRLFVVVVESPHSTHSLKPCVVNQREAHPHGVGSAGAAGAPANVAALPGKTRLRIIIKTLFF